MTVEWVPSLGLRLAVGLDGLTVALLVLIAVATTAIVAWTVSLRAPDTARLVRLLLLFVAAMCLLVGATDALTLFVAWELTSGLSYLLVGFDRSDAARRAARTTLLLTGLGGVALLVGLLLIGTSVGGFELATLLMADPGDPLVVAGAWLVLLAALTKSAQLPFHGWLTGASTAPTAASALLHAATLVVAGVYLVARLSPVLAEVPGWTAVTMASGLGTFVWAHVVAVRARKAKVLLAGTTAAQLGLAMAAAATGTNTGIAVAVGLLFVHGIYKAALFLVAGSVKARTGDPSVAAMWPGTEGLPLLRGALVVGAVALAGFPPLAGWATKEAAVSLMVDQSWVATAAVAVGAVLGVAVGGRLVGIGGPALRVVEKARLGVGVVGAPLALLLPALVLGVWTTPLQSLAKDGAAAVVAGEGAKIVLLPSLGVAVAVSVGALLLGSLLAVAGDRGISQRPAGRASAPDLLAAGIDRGLDGASAAATRVESLSRVTVVGTVAVASFGALLAAADPAAVVPAQLPLASSGSELLAGGLLIAAVLGITVVRDRLFAALLLGIVGFAMAGLFAQRGAPDLVLTQVVVETVVVLVFVGVLVRLPRSARHRGRSLDGSLTRALVALTAAALAGDLALRLAADPGPRRLSDEIVASAKPVGAGENAVNVVLTDFRALDTLGELVVLFLAAIAVLALVGAARTTGGARTDRSAWLAAATPTLSRIAIVVALHLLVVGHDLPGGGFVGGLVLGAGIALHRLGTGELPARRLLARPLLVLGSGLAVVAAVVLAPVVVGSPVADMGAWTLDLGWFGAPKLTSALVFDIGVLLVVVGLVLAALTSLGDDEVVGPGERAPADADDRPTPQTEEMV